MNRVHWVISLFIVLIIGFHAVPLIQELTGRRQTSWPLMVWGMYRKAYPSNMKINVKKTFISAKTRHGSILDVAPIHHPPFFNLVSNTYRQDEDRILLGHYGYQRLFVKPMLKGDESAARKLAALLNQDRQDRITHIQIQRELYEMGGEGIEKVDSSIMTYDVSE